MEALIAQWKDQEDGILVLQSLKYLDVVTLIKKKPVCKQWEYSCTQAIDNKCDGSSVVSGGGGTKKKFETNQELRQAVDKYSPGSDYDGNTMRCNSKDAEEIASTYGYPIGKWDVSNVTDFSSVFGRKTHFNEPIGSWDVSNATAMRLMFNHARSFNQDISSWDVSNVTDMYGMFNQTTYFNGDISSWDVSKVTCMQQMFHDVQSFNQDISYWDVSNVTNMCYMFYYATSFNQDISTWDVSNVVSNVVAFQGMFRCCPINARQFPWFREEMLLF